MGQSGDSVIAEIVKLSPQPGDVIVIRFGVELLELPAEDRREIARALVEDCKQWSKDNGVRMALLPPGLEIGLEQRDEVDS
jgi:hypothetical protein